MAVAEKHRVCRVCHHRHVVADGVAQMIDLNIDGLCVGGMFAFNVLGLAAVIVAGKIDSISRKGKLKWISSKR